MTGEVVMGAYPAPEFRCVLVRDGGRAKRPKCRTVEDTGRILRPVLGSSPVEVFVVMLLDARHGVLGVVEVARGTLTACLVHPREIFAPAIVGCAASIIVAHNHPSGDPSPSDEDRALTRRVRDAGTLLGIPVVDSVVVTDTDCRSVDG